jgi:two-component SAPR family response regulator
MEKVLLVEDDARMLRSLERLLKDSGFDVVPASNGQEALDLAQNDEFALIISDVRMPGMDGIETLGKMRTFQPHARKLIITGYADEDAPVRAIQLSVDDYLMKPFGSEFFLKSVENAISRYRMEQLKSGLIRNSSEQESKLINTVLSHIEKRMAKRPDLSYRKASLCRSLGEALELTPIQLSKLEKAAHFHDFGFISLSDEQVKHDAENRHAQVSSEILAALIEDHGAAEILKAHHQVFDFEVPPISVECEILRLCEDYENFESQDPDQPEQILRALADTKSYRPELLEALFKVILNPSLSQQSRAFSPEKPDQKWFNKFLHLAQVYVRLGESQLAEAALKKLKEAEFLIKNDDSRFRYFLVFSENLMLQKKFVESHEVSERALELAIEKKLGGLSAAKAFLEISLSRFFLSRLDQVEEMLQKCVEIFSRFEDLKNLARTHFYLAIYFFLSGRKENVETHLKNSANLLHPDQTQEWLQSESLAQTLLPSELTAPFFSSHPSKVEEIKIFSLGPFRIYRSGELMQEEEWKSKKARILLNYLLFHAERPISEERLCEIFWSGSDFEKSRKSLHNTIYLLRRILEPALEEGGQSRYILSQKGGYQFNRLTSYWWDVQEFRKKCQEAEQFSASGQSEKAIRALQQAEDLYQGDLLEDFSEEAWLGLERDKLRESYIKTLCVLSDYEEKNGRYSFALEKAQEALSFDPYHEQAALLQIRNLFKLGMRSDAIRRYHEWCAELKRELQLGPPPELAAFYLEMTS